MPRILITNNLKQSILKDTKVLFETGNYVYGNDLEIEAPSSLNGCKLSFPFKIGAFTNINPDGLIQNCTIGRYCAIATGVKIGNGNHPTNWLSVNACQYVKNCRNYNNILQGEIHTKDFDCYKHTTIGNDVWIGANVYIKDGVNIGDGAIVGANSVVTKDIEPYAIYGGVPAKLIRYRFEPHIIQKLLELKWWEYKITQFGKIDYDDIEKAIQQLEEKLPQLEKFKPKVVDSTYLNKLIKKEKVIGNLITKVRLDNKKEYYFLNKKIFEKKIGCK